MALKKVKGAVLNLSINREEMGRYEAISRETMIRELIYFAEFG